MKRKRTNLVFPFFILLLQLLSTNAEEVECGRNLIRSLMNFYSSAYVGGADIAPLSDESESDYDYHLGYVNLPNNGDGSPSRNHSRQRKDTFLHPFLIPYVNYRQQEIGYHPHLETRTVSDKKPCISLERLGKLIARFKKRHSISKTQLQKQDSTTEKINI